MDVPFIGWQRVPTTTLAEAVGTLPIRGIGRYAACALQYARDHLQGCGGDDPYGLTIDEIAALNLYTKHNFRHPSHSFYSVLNRTLCLQDRQQLLPFFPYLKLFFTAARKLPNACPAKLWRGVAKGPKDVAAVHAKGKLIYWWGVTSTTYDADVLRSPQFFGSSGDWTLFVLECHAGVDISCYSDYDEAEVLLMPGTKLIVEQVMPGELMGGATLVLLKQLISSHDLLKPQHPGGEDEDDAACGEEEAEEEDEEDVEGDDRECGEEEAEMEDEEDVEGDDRECGEEEAEMEDEEDVEGDDRECGEEEAEMEDEEDVEGDDRECGEEEAEEEDEEDVEGDDRECGEEEAEMEDEEDVEGDDRECGEEEAEMEDEEDVQGDDRECGEEEVEEDKEDVEKDSGGDEEDEDEAVDDEDEVGQSERPTKRKAPDTAAQDDAAAGEGQEEEEADEEEHDNGGPPAKKQRTSCEGIAFLLAAVLYRIVVLSPGPALAVCYAVTNQCYAFTRTHTCTSTHKYSNSHTSTDTGTNTSTSIGTSTRPKSITSTGTSCTACTGTDSCVVQCHSSSTSTSIRTCCDGSTALASGLPTAFCLFPLPVPPLLPLPSSLPLGRDFAIQVCTATRSTPLTLADNKSWHGRSSVAGERAGGR